MAQPTPYDRQFNFQNQQALTPADPLPGDEVDSEFNALKLTLDEILAKLELIQRDDGALANQSVSRDTLHSSIQLGFGAPEVWNNNTNYTADFDTVFESSKFYKCIVSHLSDPSPTGFANDIANWEEIADFSASAIQGLGTMSTQNADEVIITGGTIDGITPTGLSAPSGDNDAARKVYVDDAIATLTAYVDTQDDVLRGELSAPSGTRMVFQQTSAPTGWTKDATHNDKALRLVSGTASSGGTVAFSTVFSKTGTDATTISTSTMPAHNHGGTTASGGVDHTHPFTAGFPTGAGGLGSSGNFCSTSGANTGVASAFSHAHGVNSQGSGLGHSHAMDIRVKYVDAIIAEKD